MDSRAGGLAAEGTSVNTLAARSIIAAFYAGTIKYLRRITDRTLRIAAFLLVLGRA